MAINANKVVHLVRDINQRLNPLLPHRMSTRDFNKMYTNISSPDLITRTCDVMHQSFALHGSNNDPPVLCFIARGAKYKWYTTSTLPNNHTTRRGETFFTEDQLCDYVETLVNNTFVAFGGRACRQVVGIPMGTNPGTHLANFYLFSYELEFITSLATAAATAAAASDYSLLAVLKAFRNMVRFVDDILSISNEFFEGRLKYSEVDSYGIKGLYPDCLVLSLEQLSMKVVHFLDTAVFNSLSENTQTYRLRLTISDKRD